MPHLSAFVGHSFAAEDEQVISEILTMLENVAELMPDFDWESAEAAEPKALSAKVKAKMGTKNLFIGICTLREYAIKPSSIRSRHWPNNESVLVTRDDFEPKTADWIIQEIGMAVGRDMHIVLLLEEGLRIPGGLQGDLEYIEFRRAEPNKSLSKLVSMLRALAPKGMPNAESREPHSAHSADVMDTPESPIPAFLTPDDSWTADRYIAMHSIAISWRKPDIAAQISASFERSSFATEKLARAEFTASAISARAVTYKEEWVQQLQQLAAQFPDAPSPYLELAIRFAAVDDHKRAADFYETAARLSPMPLERIRQLVAAAIQHKRADNVARAEVLLADVAEMIRLNSVIESDGMELLASAWRVLGNDELFLACTERCLELAPDRRQPRFDLSYRYSELNQDANALFHYEKYVAASDDVSGWNNLGVTAAALKLPVIAIEAYRKSEAGGNSLATSNLAFNYLEAGFLDDAVAKCGAALEKPEPHARVIEALAKCRRAKEQEQEKESAIFRDTEMQREFRRAVGSASILPLPGLLPGAYSGPKCQLAVEFKGATLELTGTYTQPALGAIGNALIGLGGTRTETVTVRYAGRLFGHVFIGKTKTESRRAVNSLLGPDVGRECVGIVEAQFARIRILEANKELYALDAVST